MVDIRVVGDKLRGAGLKHQDAADVLRAVPDTHPQIEAFLTSLGPVFGDFRAAGGNALGRRKDCYEKQAQGHEHVNDGLHKAASTWDNHEDGAGQQFRGLTGDGAPAPAPAPGPAPAPAGGGGPTVRTVSYAVGGGLPEELITNPNPVIPGGAEGGKNMPKLPPEIVKPKINK